MLRKPEFGILLKVSDIFLKLFSGGAAADFPLPHYFLYIFSSLGGVSNVLNTAHLHFQTAVF